MAKSVSLDEAMPLSPDELLEVSLEGQEPLYCRYRSLIGGEPGKRILVVKPGMGSLREIPEGQVTGILRLN